MRAARFHGKSDIRVEDVAVPTVRNSDDVLVEVLYCGICGTDLHEYLVGPIVTPTTPHPLTGATLPQTLGHEFSARVVETGSDVTGIAVGDRVAIMPAIVCGRCHYCVTGRPVLCENRAPVRAIRNSRLPAQHGVDAMTQALGSPTQVGLKNLPHIHA